MPSCERRSRTDKSGVSKPLDLIAIGRVSVDLYGQQIGTRLEDVSSFAKAVGGCPANVAIGAARLGLKSALVTRVGDEPMGRFVREQLAREGVETRGVAVDPQRLTSLVVLAVRDAYSFPLIFYRENCADSALGEEDIDPDFVASSRAILVTGTHFSPADAARAQRKAIDVAKAQGSRVVLDIDYRPSLWGIGGHDAGEARYARSARASAALAAVLPDCDLIVGTEEELHVAAGLEDTLEAVRRIRSRSNAVIVCKRGARGCIVFAGGVPQSLEDGIVAKGLDVEVYNVLGAGDAFLAGFLRGYLRDEPHELSARLGNACGALAVSRLLCSPEFPTLAELHYYLARGSPQRALREDSQLNHLHRVTTRARAPGTVLALALDERQPLERIAARLGAPPERLERLERLAVEAVARIAPAREGCGILLGAASGAAARHEAMRRKLWVARAVEQPGSKPLEFARADSLATHLIEWPAALTVKCRCRYLSDDLPEMRHAQERNLLRLMAACRAQRRELVLEIAAERTDPGGVVAADATARALARLYELDVRPDWWQLEPQPDGDAWARCAEVIVANDEYCRGILMGDFEAQGDARDEASDEAPDAASGHAPCDNTVVRLGRALAGCRAASIVRGFAVGRTIFPGIARRWLSGQISDAAAVGALAELFSALVEMWPSAENSGPERPERSAK
jgi:5-dehydro-2-deoxygluconokinase